MWKKSVEGRTSKDLKNHTRLSPFYENGRPCHDSQDECAMRQVVPGREGGVPTSPVPSWTCGQPPWGVAVSTGPWRSHSPMGTWVKWGRPRTALQVPTDTSTKLENSRLAFRIPESLAGDPVVALVAARESLDSRVSPVGQRRTMGCGIARSQPNQIRDLGTALMMRLPSPASHALTPTRW